MFDEFCNEKGIIYYKQAFWHFVMSKNYKGEITREILIQEWELFLNEVLKSLGT